ncbi:50S ribosomal protein L21 [Candidatus Falkowbacteria bacterium]|nr:50S ribosomal protein L21 [Candidatus Falkowbacteria bacterium]
MSKIAVIKTGGKQYKVKEGDTISVEKLPEGKGKKVKLETLLIASTDGKEVNIGKPSLGEKVEAEILDEAKGKKVKVVKYKNKTRYTRNKGHRQTNSKVKITSIK